MTYFQKVSALASLSLKTQCFFQSSNENSTAAEKNERNEDVGDIFLQSSINFFSYSRARVCLEKSRNPYLGILSKQLSFLLLWASFLCDNFKESFPHFHSLFEFSQNGRQRKLILVGG